MSEFVPIAHAHKNLSHPHLLTEHAGRTGLLAAGFAAAFGAGAWAELAGRWHDLGKFSSGFQKYLRKASGFEAELVVRAPARVNHSSAGAQYAIDFFRGKGARSPAVMALAWMIAGHHGGLPDWDRLRQRMKDRQWFDATMKENIPPDMLACPVMPTFDEKSIGGGEGFHLWVRMLYSCLVDADYLDTESYFDPARNNARGSRVGMADLLGCFDAYMHKKQEGVALAEGNDGRARLNRLRADILSQCRISARQEEGIFSLTVPTGGGKHFLALLLRWSMPSGTKNSG